MQSTLEDKTCNYTHNITHKPVTSWTFTQFLSEQETADLYIRMRSLIVHCPSTAAEKGSHSVSKKKKKHVLTLRQSKL